jgi:hypothetical protein
MCNITPEPFILQVHRFIDTCTVGSQGFYFIVKDFDRRASWWIEEAFDDTDYYLAKGELTNSQVQDYTFMQQERDRIKKEVAETREQILSALAISIEDAAMEVENKNKF